MQQRKYTRVKGIGANQVRMGDEPYELRWAYRQGIVHHIDDLEPTRLGESGNTRVIHIIAENVFKGKRPIESKCFRTSGHLLPLQRTKQQRWIKHDRHIYSEQILDNASSRFFANRNEPDTL